MENCHFFPEQMMSMASIALVEAGVHHQDIMKGHMMIELEITHLCDHMMIVDDQTLCHQDILLTNHLILIKMMGVMIIDLIQLTKLLLHHLLAHIRLLIHPTITLV